MKGIQEKSKSMVGNKDIREDVLKKLKEEFDMLHKVISENEKMDPEKLSCLIEKQIELSRQIVREGRALGGENQYLFPPHALEN